MEREPDHDALLVAIGDLLGAWAHPLFFEQVLVLMCAKALYKGRGVIRGFYNERYGSLRCSIVVLWMNT